MEVRLLSSGEKAFACDLAWRVFMKYEAPEYSQKGIDEFKRFLDNTQAITLLPFYGAFDQKKLVGILAMREPQHICLFFVDEDYHRKGIGRKLFDRMAQDYESKQFTVNSSPFAVNIYQRLGFEPIDTEQITNGIKYTPMRYKNR